MSSACGQRKPIGWTPSADDDYFVGDSHCKPHQRSYSPTSSTSSLSETDQSSSRLFGNSSRRHHEPGWVARPRNAFIIFRCEYSQTHSRHGRRIRRPPGASVEPTLSKRAAIAWSQMTKEQKEPYKIRAEEERNEHARKYPDYRFRPQRRPGVGGRRYNTRYSASGPACAKPSSETLSESPVASDSPPSESTSVGSRPSVLGGSLCDPDSEHRGSITGWTLPSVYNAPEAPLSNTKLFFELTPTPSVSERFHGMQTPSPPKMKVEIPQHIPIYNPSPVPLNLPCVLNWDGEPTAVTEANSHCFESPLTGVEVTRPYDYLPPAGCSEPLDFSPQYYSVGAWPPQFAQSSLVSPTGSFDLGATQMFDGSNLYNAVNTLSAMSNYITLGDGNIVPAATAADSEYFGVYD